MRNKFKSDHHLIPQSKGGTRSNDNLIRVNDDFHKAFHRVFQNATPIEQIALLADFNRPCLSHYSQIRIRMCVSELLEEGYVYKQ